MLFPGSPAEAQQYRGSGNSRVSTIGDMPSGLLKARVRRGYSLNFSNLGLFGDAEVYPVYDATNAPAYFIFPLPDFSGAGLDFTGMSFDSYLDMVARSYESTSVGDYLLQFIYQNEFTAQTGYTPQYSEVIQVHQNDFLAGGGYLPLSGGPTIPVDPDDLPVVDEFEPFFNPLTPVTPAAASASQGEQTAAAVAVVPEPATLALITLGAAGMLTRARRR